jgi:hypothetical protein
VFETEHRFPNVARVEFPLTVGSLREFVQWHGVVDQDDRTGKVVPKISFAATRVPCIEVFELYAKKAGLDWSKS